MALSVFPRGVGFGGQDGLTSTSAVAVLRGTFSAAAATAVTLGVLPKNSVVLDVISYGGGTGGSSPTLHVGTAADDDGFANELDADGVSSALAAGTTGALINTVLEADTTVVGLKGASAATGGTASVAILYTVIA